MNIILVPKSVGKGQNISLSQRQALLLALVLLLVLPVTLGTVTFKIHGLLTTESEFRNPQYLVEQERRLQAQRQEVEEARRNAELHLNALAQRLGHMQAQLLRLNALGQRLSRMAGLDKNEFDFSEEPAMGGPETSAPLSALNNPELLKSIDGLSGQMERNTHRLGVLESLLMDRQLQAAVHPGGWPTEGGWQSSGFGLRTDPFTGRKAYHEGVDIASRMGSVIKAMGGGVVSHAGEKNSYGLTVEINHGNGLVTRYAHASAVMVKVGDRVEKGQPVALVGTSGRSTGPHLHFEVLRNGRAVDPQPFLRSS
jgi:murein DD-endopeptidase MepM/ murein hydrolase activator NlpD